jgi:hypothetical protein
MHYPSSEEEIPLTQRQSSCHGEYDTNEMLRDISGLENIQFMQSSSQKDAFPSSSQKGAFQKPAVYAPLCSDARDDELVQTMEKIERASQIRFCVPKSDQKWQN